MDGGVAGRISPRAAGMSRAPDASAAAADRAQPGGSYPDSTRRRLLAAALGLPLALELAACAAPLPELKSQTTSAVARALLADSAAAHGSKVFAGLNDINVSYAGRWHPLVKRLQPVLVDAGHRGGSQERILRDNLTVAQAHSGPQGAKQVLRLAGRSTPGEVRVWFDGVESADAEQRAAAALVADAYSLFLLGPMLLEQAWLAERGAIMEFTGSAELVQEGKSRLCDVLAVRINPGLGFSAGDQLALFIDRDSRLMRRVRFTLNGLESTRGAIAEVDTLEPLERHGIRWPTRFHEQLRRPFSLAVHDWRLTGLDVDRGLEAPAVSGALFSGAAARPAQPLTG